MKKRRVWITAAMLALSALMCVGAFAAVIYSGDDLAAKLNAAQNGDSLELATNFTVSDDATLASGVTLTSDGADKRTVTVADGKTLTIDLNAAVAGTVALKGQLALANNGSTVTSVIGAPKVNGAAATGTTGGAFAYDTGSATTADVTIPFSGAIQYEQLNATLVLKSEDKTIVGERSGSAVAFEDVPVNNATKYDIMLRIGHEDSNLYKTVNSLTLFASDTAKVTPKADFANIKAGSTVDAFTIANPAAFPVKVETNNAAITVNSDGKLTAASPMSGKFTFTFAFTLPDGKEKTVTVEKDVTVGSPVTAPKSADVYVNQRTKVFTVNLPDGYVLDSVKADDADIQIITTDNGEYITATKTLNKDVKFSFTFKNGDKSFTAEHTVRVRATVYRPRYPVTVTAPKYYISVGESIQLSVPYEKISNATSSNVKVAFGKGNGTVVGIAPGTAILYVDTVGGGYGSIQITVTGASLSLYAGSSTLSEGDTTQIFASTGEAITNAHSSNSTIATVTQNGKVTAKAPGTVTIYAGTASGRGGSVTLTITKAALKLSGKTSMKVGDQSQLTASGQTILSLSSSNSNVVKCYGNWYYAVGEGTATLTATSVSGRTGTLVVTVAGDTPSVVSKTVKAGKSLQLSFPGQSIDACYSADTSVATVTAKGKVTGKQAGATTIYVYTKSGKQITVNLTVTGSASTGGSTSTGSTKVLEVGQSVTYSLKGKTIVGATLEKDNGTLKVTSKGKVTALAAGSDTVLLITSDNRVYRVNITVIENDEIEIEEDEIPVDGTIKLSKATNKLRLRKTIGGSTVAYLNHGTKVTILDAEGAYYKVSAKIGGKTYTGYVAQKYVK